MIAMRSAYFTNTSSNVAARDRSSQYPFARYRAANSGGKRTTPANIPTSLRPPPVQAVPAVQSLRSVQAPTSFLPRVAGEERGGGLNGLNYWNDWNQWGRSYG